MESKYALPPAWSRLIQLAAFGLLVFGLSGISIAQTAEPQKQQLLNGLRILFWPRPGSEDVLLKLRIHSGAAFDPAGKEGTMALLGDLLFPDAATHAYFTEETRNGRLDVETNYDSMTITLKGRAAEYDRIVDFLRGALLATPLSPDVVARIRDAKIAELKAEKRSAANVADWSIAERLLGSFPYTRPIEGTAASLVRVERADLMSARDRFLNPNNATLAIVGGVDERQGMPALRQLLGGWRKSDQIVPATFRQPAAPDTRTLIVNSTEPSSTQVRLAFRGLARADTDFPAAAMLTRLAAMRWQKLQPELGAKVPTVRLDSNLLPGMFVMSASVDAASTAKTLDAARAVIKSLVETAPSAEEFQEARATVISAGPAPKQDPTDFVATQWLDLDTYSLAAISDQNRLRTAITAGDLQRVAARLFRDTPAASVTVGDAERLKAQLGPTNKIVTADEIAKPAPAEQKPANESPASENQRRPPGFQIKRPNPMVKSTKPAEKPD